MKTRSKRAVEAADRLQRRALAHLDAVREARVGDVALGERDSFGIELARDDPPAGGQRLRHRQRAVARVGADLEHEPRLGEEDEELEEAALDLAGEHLRRVELGTRLLGERLQKRRRRGRVGGRVGLDRLGDDERAHTIGGRGGGGGGLTAPAMAPPMLPSACENSLGMTKILFASPCASLGSICRYW